MKGVCLGLNPVKEILQPWRDERDTLVRRLLQHWWVQCLVCALLSPFTPGRVVVASFVSLVND